MIFSTLSQLDFPCYTGEPVLLGVQPAHCFKVSNQHAALFCLGRSWGGLRDVPGSGEQDRHRVSAALQESGVCTVASGLLPSAICGLPRGPWGAGDSDFRGFTEAPGICLGSWDERRALGPPLCRCAVAEGGAFHRGRQRPSPARVRTAASLGRQERIFQDTCHMLRGPRKEEFP